MGFSFAGHGWDVKSVDWHPQKALLVSGGLTQMLLSSHGYNEYLRTKSFSSVLIKHGKWNRCKGQSSQTLGCQDWTRTLYSVSSFIACVPLWITLCYRLVVQAWLYFVE